MAKNNRESQVNNQTSLTNVSSDQPGFWRELYQQVRLVYYLVLDPQVPFYLKLLPAVAIIYLLLPIDILPDVIPGLGQLDDLTILLVGAKVFIDMSPKNIVAQYMSRIRRKDGFDSGQYADPDFDGEQLNSFDDDDVVEGIIIEDVDQTD